MSHIRSLLSAGVFGLAAIVAQPSLAQPEGGKPGPARPGPGPAKAPGKPMAAPGPRPPGGASSANKPGQAHGQGKGKPGEHGKGKKGKKGDGKDKKEKKEKKDTGPSKREALQAKRDAGKPLTPDEKEELERLWAKRMELAKKRVGPHQAAFFSLLEKEKEGKLSNEERQQLKRLNEVRKRHRGLKKRQGRRDSNRQRRLRRAKRNLLKKFPSVVKDDAARAELKKHAQREAMLERIIDVAKAEGNEKLVKRAEQLTAKEQARHTQWMKKHFSNATQGEKK